MPGYASACRRCQRPVLQVGGVVVCGWCVVGVSSPGIGALSMWVVIRHPCLNKRPLGVRLPAVAGRSPVAQKACWEGGSQQPCQVVQPPRVVKECHRMGVCSLGVVCGHVGNGPGAGAGAPCRGGHVPQAWGTFLPGVGRLRGHRHTLSLCGAGRPGWGMPTGACPAMDPMVVGMGLEWRNMPLSTTRAFIAGNRPKLVCHQPRIDDAQIIVTRLECPLLGRLLR